MEGNKALIFTILAFLSFIPLLFSQSKDSLDRTPDAISQELASAVKTSNDTAYIKRILAQGPDYTLKGEYNMNALEAAYYEGNRDVYNCVLDYILMQKDTAFVQKSEVLGMATASGDTLTMSRLFSIYRNKMNNEEIANTIEDFFEFCFDYDQRNQSRSGFFAPEFNLSTTTDYDLRLAEFMISHGIDFNTINSKGQNILFYIFRHAEISKFFIEKKAIKDLNALDKKGQTFLQCYIDNITTPLKLPNDFLEESEKETHYYGKLIDLMNYYIQAGATVGPKHQNGWEYMMEVLKPSYYPYLYNFVTTNYSEYIK